jgi:DNA-binding NtrC family response regulator
MLATLSQQVKDLQKSVKDLQGRMMGATSSPSTTELLPATSSFVDNSIVDAEEYYEPEEADAQEVTELTMETNEEKKDSPKVNAATLSRKDIAAALRRCKGNKKAAAQDLGVPERTLFRKIKLYGLDTADFE